MRVRGGAVAIFVCLALGASASASFATSPQVTSLVQRAGLLPEPVNTKTAQHNWKALRSGVLRAIAEGRAGEVAESGNQDLAGALLRYGKVRVGGETSNSTVPKESGVTAGVAAHASGCYGAEVNQRTLELGVKIAWLYVRANGWCGIPGERIYWNGGPTFADWELPVYCLTGHGTDWSWDQYPRWIHGANWGTIGINYKVGCVGIRGLKAAIRLAANGYYDYYNDYGF